MFWDWIWACMFLTDMYILVIENIKSNMYVVSICKSIVHFIIYLWNSNYLVATISQRFGFCCVVSITIGHKLHTIMAISWQCMWNVMVSFCAWLIDSMKFTHFCTHFITSILTFVFLLPPYATLLFWNFSSRISSFSQCQKVLILVVWPSFVNNSLQGFITIGFLLLFMFINIPRSQYVSFNNIAILTINIVLQNFYFLSIVFVQINSILIFSNLSNSSNNFHLKIFK